MKFAAHITYNEDPDGIMYHLIEALLACMCNYTVKNHPRTKPDDKFIIDIKGYVKDNYNIKYVHSWINDTISQSGLCEYEGDYTE